MENSPYRSSDILLPFVATKISCRWSALTWRRALVYNAINLFFGTIIKLLLAQPTEDVQLMYPFFACDVLIWFLINFKIVKTEV